MITIIKEKIHSYQPKRLFKTIPEAAVLCLISNEENPRIHFIKRAQSLSKHAGEIAFPGGKEDVVDQSLLQTALRETYEEIGIQQNKIEFLGMLDQQISLHNLKVSPFLGLINKDQQFNLNPLEVERLFSVEIDYFLSKTNYSSYDKSLHNQKITSHQFVYKNDIIWGLTAYIVVNFLNTIFDADFKIGSR